MPIAYRQQALDARRDRPVARVRPPRVGRWPIAIFCAAAITVCGFALLPLIESGSVVAFAAKDGKLQAQTMRDGQWLAHHVPHGAGCGIEIVLPAAFIGENFVSRTKAWVTPRPPARPFSGRLQRRGAGWFIVPDARCQSAAADPVIAFTLEQTSLARVIAASLGRLGVRNGR